MSADELRAVVAEQATRLRDLQHRVLTLRDHAIGCEAEVASARATERTSVEALEGVLGSRTWRTAIALRDPRRTGGRIVRLLIRRVLGR